MLLKLGGKQNKSKTHWEIKLYKQAWLGDLPLLLGISKNTHDDSGLTMSSKGRIPCYYNVDNGGKKRELWNQLCSDNTWRLHLFWRTCPMTTRYRAYLPSSFISFIFSFHPDSHASCHYQGSEDTQSVGSLLKDFLLQLHLYFSDLYVSIICGSLSSVETDKPRDGNMRICISNKLPLCRSTTTLSHTGL